MLDWGLLDPLSGPADSVVGDDAILRAMIAFEEALADARGLKIPEHFDEPDRTRLLAGAREHGNPVIPLVDALRKQGGDDLHRGATSQDVVDTALVLVASTAVDHMVRDLLVTGEALGAIVGRHDQHPTLARTLTQHAQVFTIGTRVASWLDGITASVEVLGELTFPVQLGGAVGDGAELTKAGEDPAKVRAAVADELGLADPGRSWHSERTPIARIATTVGIAVGALGRIGADLALLASSEIAEVNLPSGRSSAMEHKRNPVTPILLVAAATRSPGLVSSVLSGMVSPTERAPGAWHAQWQPFRELLRLGVETADAAAGLAPKVTFDVERAAANVAAFEELNR